MRLAYLLKKFPRLSETFVLGEILGQEALGLDIHVFSRRETDDEPRHPQLAELRAPIEVLPSPRRIDPWSALFAAGDGITELLAGVERMVRRNEQWGHERFADLVAEALYLRRRTAELGIDHVHVHFATDSAITAMILQELGGPGYSITAHAKDIYRNTVSPDLLEHLLANSRFTVTVCDANVRHLETLVGERAMQRVRRHYNGIERAAFAPDGKPRHERKVLAVGRLVEKKGFDVMIEALALLDRRGVPFEAAIVGDGEERENLAHQLQRVGLTDRVRLTGPLDSEAVRAEMAAATVFCLPCIVGEDGNRDALPTVLLEAMAGGLPIVSTPVTGIPEILDDGRAGALVPERDPEATADALEALLGDPMQRERYATAGLTRAERLFDRTTQAEVLNGWFHQAPVELAVR